MKLDLRKIPAIYINLQRDIEKNEYILSADFDKPDGNILDNFSSTFDFTGLNEKNTEKLTWEIIYPILMERLREKLNI